MSGVKYEELNKEIKQWAFISKKMMLRRLHVLTNSEKHNLLRTKKHTPLEKTLKYKSYKTLGEIYRISFPFAVHGFFLAAGYSRKHGKNNPRKKVDWYSFVYDERTKMLAEIIAKHYGDKAALRISNRLNPK